MITAIVYKSNTGFTKKYAELLSAGISLPCCSLEEAESQLNKGDSIIYLGWLMAGSVKGLKKAKQKYKVCAAAGVGMTEASDEFLATIKKMNHLESIPCFYLRGGFDISKLHGLNKLILNTAVASSAKKEGGSVPSEADYISNENLCELSDWYRRSC